MSASEEFSEQVMNKFMFMMNELDLYKLSISKAYILTCYFLMKNEDIDLLKLKELDKLDKTFSEEQMEEKFSLAKNNIFRPSINKRIDAIWEAYGSYSPCTLISLIRIDNELYNV